MLTVLDEFTRQALCVEVQDKINPDDVLVLFVLIMAESLLLNNFKIGLERLA